MAELQSNMRRTGAGGTLGDMLPLLLGSGNEYVGDSAMTMPERRRSCLEKACRAALKKLGDAVADAASVPPRVVGLWLEQASYCEDDLATEYLAGILACSRTAIFRDDRALRRLALLSRLSLLQIRTHYLFYATLRRLLLARPGAKPADLESSRYRLAVFVPVGPYVRAMALEPAEIRSTATLAGDILTGLGAELLLDGSNTGTEEYLKRYFDSPAIRGEGIVFAPSLAGVELFLWAFGKNDGTTARYLSPALDCGTNAAPAAIEGAEMIYSPGPSRKETRGGGT